MKLFLKYLVFFVLFFFYNMGFVIIFMRPDLKVVPTVLYFLCQFVFIFLFYKALQYNSKSKVINLILIILHFIFYVTFFHFYLYSFINLISPKFYSEMPDMEFLYSFAEYYFQFMPFAFIYWFYKRSINNEKKARAKEKENNILQTENLQLTAKTIEADYNYLRTQINPHFLYNTLGFIYTKVAMQDHETGTCVEMLINLMRYSLHKGDAQGRVPLQHEIENVDNYIGLQKIRFGNKLQLVYHKNVPEVSPLKIIPHLLLTVVENAFKHGNNSDPEQPLQITIEVKEDILNFTVINLINQVQVELPSTKTGLQNMEDRLAMVYKERQQFSHTIKDNLFMVTLQINLNGENDRVATVEDTQEAIEIPLSNTDAKSTGFNKAALL
jgi:two-component system, LytTR family, sensor kinase